VGQGDILHADWQSALRHHSAIAPPALMKAAIGGLVLSGFASAGLLAQNLAVKGETVYSMAVALLQPVVRIVLNQALSCPQSTFPAHANRHSADRPKASG
jgi:hypothetical protein